MSDELAAASARSPNVQSYVIERLAPKWQTDELLSDLVSMLRNGGLSDGAEQLSAWIVENNALKAEAAFLIKTLTDEIDMLTKAGIIEVAIRNPNVADYMAHWERRAESAEMTLEHIFGVKMAAEDSVMYEGSHGQRYWPDTVSRTEIIALVKRVNSAELEPDQDAFNRAIIDLDSALDRFRARAK